LFNIKSFSITYNLLLTLLLRKFLDFMKKFTIFLNILQQFVRHLYSFVIFIYVCESMEIRKIGDGSQFANVRGCDYVNSGDSNRDLRSAGLASSQHSSMPNLVQTPAHSIPSLDLIHHSQTSGGITEGTNLATYDVNRLHTLLGGLIENDKQIKLSLLYHQNFAFRSSVRLLETFLGKKSTISTDLPSLFSSQEQLLTSYISTLSTFKTGLQNQTKRTVQYVDFLLAQTRESLDAKPADSSKFLQNPTIVERRNYLDQLYRADMAKHVSDSHETYLRDFSHLELVLRDAHHSVDKLLHTAVLHRDYIHNVKIPLLSLGMTTAVVSNLNKTTGDMRKFTAQLYGDTVNAVGLLQQASQHHDYARLIRADVPNLYGTQIISSRFTQ
jgi:hypothetical protein